MKVRLKPSQGKVFRCPERFRVLVAGRRFGKTFLALNGAGPGRLGARPKGVVRRAHV